MLSTLSPPKRDRVLENTEAVTEILEGLHPGKEKPEIKQLQFQTKTPENYVKAPLEEENIIQTLHKFSYTKSTFNKITRQAKKISK